MKYRVIGIIGKKYHGKDTIADLFLQNMVTKKLVLLTH